MTLNKFKRHTNRNIIQSLKKEEILRVKSSRDGQIISCESGILWITQEGDWVDRLLTAGEKFRTRIPGFILVQALSDARIRISPQEKVELICPAPQSLQEELACA